VDWFHGWLLDGLLFRGIIGSLCAVVVSLFLLLDFIGLVLLA
jgi:hypothetical protein